MKNRPAIGSTNVARRLRRNSTEAERALWDLLREAFPASRFRRQVPLLNYVADFASHRERLIIEVDGGQHGCAYDEQRTRRIEAEGYRVIRFWNNEVLENPEGVARAITAALAGTAPLERPPPPKPSPVKGEG